MFCGESESYADCTCLESGRCMQAMGMALHSHATLPSGMTHSGHFMAPMEAPPPTWPVHVAQQMRHQQQLKEAQVPQGHHQSQSWQGDPQWQAHQRHSSRQQSSVTSPSMSRSGNLSNQHSGEHPSCRFNTAPIVSPSHVLLCRHCACITEQSGWHVREYVYSNSL